MLTDNGSPIGHQSASQLLQQFGANTLGQAIFGVTQ
jgi:hypothetical protein